MLRLMHGLPAMLPHKAWLFVDDLLAALRRSAGGEQLAIMAIFFCAISAPISWKKAQFQDQINWCGWSVHFGHDTIHLMEAKLALAYSDLQPSREHVLHFGFHMAVLPFQLGLYRSHDCRHWLKSLSAQASQCVAEPTCPPCQHRISQHGLESQTQTQPYPRTVSFVSIGYRGALLVPRLFLWPCHHC